MALTDKLSAIGNAIRAKTGGTDMLTLDQMPTAIAGIQTGSGGSDELAKKIITREGNITELPSDITKIGNCAFYNYTNLALTSLPSGITSIGDYAFYYCENLALTSLPEGITSIGDYTFCGCKNLSLTSLPSSVNIIENHAFRYCTSLTTLTFKGTPTGISDSAFYRCDKLTNIYVPWAEGAVSGAPWGATNATIHYNTTT